MELAHVILAHQDPIHIKRLANRLSSFSDVYIHIDAKADIELFRLDHPRVFFLDQRHHCTWGAWDAVRAEIELLRTALSRKNYDRIVFLQGADYPLKSDGEIFSFFESHRETEFMRACQCTGVESPYFYNKCRYYLFYNKPNLLKKVLNKLTRIFNLRLRSGYIKDGEEKYPVYWGSAQWAITGEFARYLLEFYDSHPRFNRWFYHSFPADELYFPTVMMNSPFSVKTQKGGAEEAVAGLQNWRNLHFFEYLPGSIRVFTKEDAAFVASLPDLYIRKVNTKESEELLDLLDQQ